MRPEALWSFYLTFFLVKILIFVIVLLHFLDFLKTYGILQTYSVPDQHVKKRFDHFRAQSYVTSNSLMGVIEIY